MLMLSFLMRQYIQYAFLIGIALSVSAALLSPYLVLNQQSLITDGLAHVSFTGLILGILLVDQPFYVAVPFVVLAALLIKYLSTKKTMNTDAVIGVVSAVAFAIGLIIISQSSGFNRVIEGMLVGNIFTVTDTELLFSLLVLVAIVGFVIRYYKPLLLVTYDLEYAKFAKIRYQFLSYGLAVLAALLVVIGVRTIGTLLISSLVIFPTLVASQFCRSFQSVLLCGIGLSIIITITGIFSAHYLQTPAGSTIVVLYAIVLLISFLLRPLLRKGDA